MKSVLEYVECVLERAKNAWEYAQNALEYLKTCLRINKNDSKYVKIVFECAKTLIDILSVSYLVTSRASHQNVLPY